MGLLDIRQSRRRVLLALAGSVALPRGALSLANVISGADLAESPFIFGVASGDPLPDRVIIWTRLRIQPPDTVRYRDDLPFEVKWEVFDAPQNGTKVAHGTAVAWPELGHSVHVDVTGLDAGREYWYRFSCGRQVSEPGRTRTADPSADSVTFAVVSCNNFEHGYFRAFELIAEDAPDFVFHAGDYIYEGPPKGDTPRTHTNGDCVTLTDYRRRYEQYRSDPRLRALHQTTPFIGSWDDHEVAGNWAALHDKHGTPVEVFQHRRRAAFQAFYEFVPMRIDRWMTEDPFPLFRSFRFGGHLSFVVLDTRQFRDNQACDTKLAAPCREFDDRTRTMLGDRQFAWLEETLAHNHGHWAVMGNQVPSYRRGLQRGQDTLYSMDKWDGYPRAQDDFHALLRRHADKSCLVLSGDLHAHYASELRADWSRSDSVFGAEYTVTSVCSGGDGSEERGDWPMLRRDNPHISYHSNRRGYLRCKATEARIDTDFVLLEKVTSPEGRYRIGARARLERGRPRPEITVADTGSDPWR